MTTKDSNGKEIKPGDIIEAVDCPEGSGEKYHVCFADRWGDVEIRDLGNNNLYAWQQYNVIKNLGHFSANAKLLNYEDLEHSFGLNIDKLLDNGVTSLIVNGVEMIENEP